MSRAVGGNKRLRETAKKSRPQTTGLRVKRPASAETISRILEAARITLIKDGYAQLSARQVAARAGLSLGNLTYHFPNMQSLTRALVDAMLKEYGDQIERTLSDVSRRGPDRLEALIHLLVRESASEPIMRLFRELWVMALHDRAAARAVDDFYDAMLVRTKTLLKSVRPKASEADIGRLLLFCAMISEGSSVIFGTRSKREHSSSEMATFAAGVVKSILEKMA